MAWSDRRDDENVESHFLAVLEWRRKATGWTVYSGSVYKVGFSFGHVIGVLQGESDATSTELVEASSLSAISTGQFYFDYFTDTLYVHIGGGDPNTKFMVATYEMHVATTDVDSPRDPLDSTSRVLYFDPYIAGGGPRRQQSLSDAIFGVQPDFQTSIEINNAGHPMERHLHDGSVNNSRIRVYSWLRKDQQEKIDPANVKLVIDGTMGSPQYARTRVSIPVYDQIRVFTPEFRPAGSEFYTLTDFPEVDKTFLYQPIRSVRGVVYGMPAVNVDYLDENPTSSDNRVWVVQAGQADPGTVVRTVAASPASTATRTYVSVNHGIRVGDSVRVAKTTPESRTVTVVGSNYIEHAAFASGAASSGDTVTRGHVGSVSIIQDNVLYEAQLGVHFNLSSLAGDTLGFTFTSAIDSGLSPLLPNVLTPSDQVFVTAYGKKATSITLGGNPFGSNSPDTGNLTSAVVILYDLMKSYAGIPESQIDTASFVALEASVVDQVGFGIPVDSTSGTFPQIHDLVLDICKTSLLRLLLNEDGMWTLQQLGPQSAARFSIGETEVLPPDVQVNYAYENVASDVTLSYARREVPVKIFDNNPDLQKVQASSLNARFLHGQVRTYEHETLHFLASDAQRCANRISFVFSERRATYKFSAKNRFMRTTLGDSIDLVKPVIPDPSFDETLLPEDRPSITRRVLVDDTGLGLREMELEAVDQKGIEDHAGSWG